MPKVARLYIIICERKESLYRLRRLIGSVLEASYGHHPAMCRAMSVCYVSGMMLLFDEVSQPQDAVGDGL